MILASITLEAEEDQAATARLRKGESVGRPVGSDTFLAALETRTRRRLHALKRGPKPKDDGATATRGNMHCHRNG